MNILSIATQEAYPFFQHRLVFSPTFAILIAGVYPEITLAI
jgi:hypothetical protein